mgnify:CR=1 FL=1
MLAIKNHPALAGVNLGRTGRAGTPPGALVTKTLLFAGEGSGLFATGKFSGGPMFRAHDKATGEIVAENSNGSVELQLPQAQSVEVGKHSARAKVPGRSQPIRLETTNGSIRIH